MSWISQGIHKSFAGSKGKLNVNDWQSSESSVQNLLRQKTEATALVSQ